MVDDAGVGMQRRRADAVVADQRGHARARAAARTCEAPLERPRVVGDRIAVGVEALGLDE